MTVMFFLLLGVAFLPAVGYTSRLLIARMRPPKSRPTTFIFGGILFVSVGLFISYLVVSAAFSGSVPCALKNCGPSFAMDLQPVAYWVSIVAWYFFAVISFGLGIAGIRKSTHEP